MKYELSPKIVFCSAILGGISALLSVFWLGSLIYEKYAKKKNCNVSFPK